MLVGAMSGPLGGDRLAVEAEVGRGPAARRIGRRDHRPAGTGQGRGPLRRAARRVRRGELRWLPEQLISAQGSDLYVSSRVELRSGARLVFREEQVLGRVGEQPGRLTSRLTVRLDGRPLLDQELSCGPGAPGGWDGPAGLGGHRALGQLVVVRPEFERAAAGAAVGGVRGRHAARRPRGLGERPGAGRAATAAGTGRGIARTRPISRQVLSAQRDLVLRLSEW